MDDCLSIEFVPAAIGDVGAGGVRFLLYAPAKKIPSGKLRALRAHDSYEHVAVGVVHDVSCSILTEGVADVAGGVPIFPGYEPPCADERIRCHKSFPCPVRERPCAHHDATCRCRARTS